MIIFLRLIFFIISCKFKNDLQIYLLLLNFGISRNKDVVFYWKETFSDESNTFNLKQEFVVSTHSKTVDNKNNSLKRKNSFCKIVVSNIEKFPCKFNLLFRKSNNEVNSGINKEINIEISNYDYNEFKILSDFLNDFYISKKNLSIKQFCPFISIFEYLETIIDENFYKIIDLLIWKVYNYLETDKRAFKVDFLRVERIFGVSKKMEDILFLRMYKNFIDFDPNNDSFFENYFIDFLIDEHRLEFLGGNLRVFSVSEGSISIIKKLSKKNELIFELFYCFFHIFNIRKFIFYNSSILFLDVSNILSLFVEFLDEIIFFNQIIKDETILRLMNDKKIFFDVFDKLEIIFVIFNVKRKIDKKFNSEKRIMAIIQAIKFRISDNFEKNLYKLIDCKGIPENKEYFITKNTKIREIRDLILMKNEIIKLFVYIRTSISEEILSLFDIFINLKSIEIYNFPHKIAKTSFNELTLILQNCRITEDFINLLVKNCKYIDIKNTLFYESGNEIEEFNIIHDFEDNHINVLLLLQLLDNLKCFAIPGKNISKILFTNELRSFLSNKTLENFAINSIESSSVKTIFFLACKIVEKFHFGSGFSPGTLKTLFFDIKMQDLKGFSIYDCKIDKRDKISFENLTSLIYLEIENCKFQNIKFHCLFNSEKEYVIEELILIKIELYRTDIDLITAFKHLNSIVFDCCYTPDKCFLKIDVNIF
ncbi:hypothetical protein CWI38_0544p0020 [Hamiltosporidium tvaerminnensis]|uniref:Uncharacterized protein n=1 Tax=Hamiltosporidium tvaerminnensis TaxID=1176355 RepID=A0A4Q9LXF4_9MICR|nr:hypothetical protein CWI38_0544p0020 [Hamiltosporidium tvaerminnensis]